MKAWIIGSEGMLGKTFVKYLKGRAQLLPTHRRELDVTDPEAVRKFACEFLPEIWINCSAYTKVDLAEEEQEIAYKVNSEGPYNLGKIAQDLKTNTYKPQIIHFSTDYVFEGTASEPYLESDLARPINIYGKSKLEGEERLRAVYPHHIIFRLSWLFASGGKNFVTTMLDLMAKNEIVRVVDDQVARPTYCEDVARIAWDLQAHTGLYHLCNLESVSWHGFAQEIAHQARSLGANLKVQLIEPISSSELDRPALRPAYSVLDTKLIESLGIHERSWTEALRECLKIILEGS